MLWLIEWAVNILCLLILLFSLWTTPWRKLMGEQGLQHLLFGAVVALVCVWSIRAELTPELSIHFWGTATLALMFGFDLAVIIGTAALIAITVLGQQSWAMLPLNMVAHIAIPVALIIGMRRLLEIYWGKNFFLYLLGCGFIGGGVSAFIGGLVAATILVLSGQLSWFTITHEYVNYFPLLLFFEGFINGVLMTGMMVFHPDWIRSFDAQGYIDRQ